MEALKTTVTSILPNGDHPGAGLKKPFGRHGLRISIALICLLFAASLWGGLFVHLTSERERIIQSKIQENDNLTRVFEEHIARTIRAAEVVLQEIESEYQRHGVKFDLYQYANSRSIYLDPYNILSIVDEYGNLTLANSPLTKQISLRNTDSYQHHARHDTPGIFISLPRKGSTTGKWTVYLTHRINKADGSFGGLSNVGIDPGYFSRIYTEIDLGRNSVVSLVGRDGIIRARSTGADLSAGQNVANSSLFTSLLPAADHGHFIRESIVDRVPRINSYRALKNYPLVVVVGTSQAVALADYEKRRSTYIQAAGAITAVMLSLGLFALFQIEMSARESKARRLSEQALRQERKLVTSISEVAPVIMVSLDPDGRIQYINPHFQELTGYRLDEVQGKVWFDTFLPERDRQRIRALFNTTAGGVPTRSNINPIVTRGGEEREIEWHGHATRDQQGNFLGIVAIGHDVTERKRSEEALRESEFRLNEAQRIAHLGSWELDLVINKLIWSEEIFRIFEIDSSKFSATYEAFLNAIHPEDRETVNAAYTQSLAARTPYEITHRLLMTDGRIKYVHERCESKFDAAGKPLRSLGTVQDITERKNTEEQIRILNAELEQRVKERTAELESVNKELETFTYSVAHDLKAPLRGIDGYSRLLMAGSATGLDGEGRFFLQNIVYATQHMNQLIEDLLAYSRLEQRDMETAPVDPRAIIELLLAKCAGEIKARGVAVTVTAPSSPVTADREGLAMALRNLLENALKFTSDASQPIIEIGRRDTAATCILSVRDNGIGFDMEFHDRIFGIFQRLHRSEDYPGTGIGLAIAKRAMKRMGGRVWAESAPGKGATFYLEIPK